VWALAPPLKVNDANGELHGAGGEWQVCLWLLAQTPFCAGFFCPANTAESLGRRVLLARVMGPLSASK